MKKKTKWTAIYAYNYDGTDLIIFAKKRKSGLLDFRTKRITGRLRSSYALSTDIFDIADVLKKLLNETN